MEHSLCSKPASLGTTQATKQSRWEGMLRKEGRFVSNVTERSQNCTNAARAFADAQGCWSKTVLDCNFTAVQSSAGPFQRQCSATNQVSAVVRFAVYKADLLVLILMATVRRSYLHFHLREKTVLISVPVLTLVAQLDDPEDS